MNTQSSGVLVQNAKLAPMTQRSIARIKRLRIAAGMNSAAVTSSPCASIMRSTVSYMTWCSPLKLAIGRCASLKRFSISAALICCTQISSKRCTRVLSSEVCCSTTWLPP